MPSTPSTGLQRMLGVCLVLAACGSDHMGPNKEPLLTAVTLDGVTLPIDTVSAELLADGEFDFQLYQRPTPGVTRNIAIWVRSATTPGDYVLSDFVQGDGAAWYQDDPDTAAMGFTGFRPLLTEPGTFTVTAIDTMSHVITASFSFVGRQYSPLVSDSAVHVVGYLRVRYVRDTL